MLLTACSGETQSSAPASTVHLDSLPNHAPNVVNQTAMLAGLRYSDYSLAGQVKGPDGTYWSKSAGSMAGAFNATPAVLWTVGDIVASDHIRLSFPQPQSATDVDPHIEFGSTDVNQAALRTFDQQGVRVWLMVEPGGAPVDKVIDLVLTQYNSHPCVVGVGVDAEWLGVAVDTTGAVIAGGDGTPVTDALAQSWIAVLQRHDPGLKLLLKHWQSENLPPTLRKGVVYLADGQGYSNLQGMVTDFTAFARAMAPAPVGFLYGYATDAAWWCQLTAAPHDIGAAILASVPDAQGLFWVDTTALNVFPQATYTCAN